MVCRIFSQPFPRCRELNVPRLPTHPSRLLHVVDLSVPGAIYNITNSDWRTYKFLGNGKKMSGHNSTIMTFSTLWYTTLWQPNATSMIDVAIQFDYYEQKEPGLSIPRDACWFWGYRYGNPLTTHYDLQTAAASKLLIMHVPEIITGIFLYTKPPSCSPEYFRSTQVSLAK